MSTENKPLDDERLAEIEARVKHADGERTLEIRGDLRDIKLLDAARQDIPDLVAEVRRLQAELQARTPTVDRNCDCCGNKECSQMWLDAAHLVCPEFVDRYTREP